MGLVPTALAALADVTDVKTVLGHIVDAGVFPNLSSLEVSPYNGASVGISFNIVPFSVLLVHLMGTPSKVRYRVVKLIVVDMVNLRVIVGVGYKGQGGLSVNPK